MAERYPGGDEQVRVRGTRDGLVLRLPPEAPLPALLGLVRGSIDGGGEFFQQSEIVIDYGTRVPNVEEIVALRALLEERGVRLRTVISNNPRHGETLRSWGYQPLRLVTHGSADDAQDVGMSQASEAERPALYLRRTLRSGASIRSDGDVVIVGDINAGAEVMAAGDVLVWGAIRGTVHAGIDGDFGAIICALRLMPTQLRIATIFARPPDQRDTGPDIPMVARVHNGEIIVEPWRPERRGARS
ncbi:MAG TPA: septum site-determining protein MinC [Nitrolancea sp.]|jgi:septum site-determining protein MinC|nr:septum site-determining protein MinC [Nitrolancea sp.]